MPSPESHSPAVSPATYQPGLDGLRAIAVVAVLLFHGGMEWLPGGFLGVDVFFVLSGYLITGILIRNPSASFGHFYLRRFRRLYPALIVMLLATITCAATLMPDSAASTVRDLPWALTSLSNWWFVFHHVPYFEAMGRPPLFRHTWSLAVEAQFYLFWPLVIRLAFPKFGRTGIRYIAFTLGAISAGLLVFISLTVDTAGADASRAYFGTDSHSIGLFLGAALATIQRSSAERSRKRQILPDALGFVTLATLFALFHLVDDSIAHYRYGLPLASLCSVVLIMVATLPGGALAWILSTAPLRWVGTRSYSIYLWHWPIFQATRPGIDTTAKPVLNFLLRLVLTAVVSELSYRYIEMPMRLGIVRRLREVGDGWSPAVSRFAVTGLAATALGAGVMETNLIRHAMRTSVQPTVIVPLPPPPAPVTINAVSTTIPAPSTLTPNKALLADPDKPEILKTPTLLLGDSVLLGVSQWLAQKVNIVKIDATVGRQATELRHRAESLAEADDPLPPVAIINLGNNGTVDEPTLRAIIDALKPCRRIVVVNTRVPRKWQDDNDVLIAKVVPDYGNAVLADWRAASEGHPEYFNADGVHANVAGAKAYTELVVAALIEEPRTKAGDELIGPPARPPHPFVKMPPPTDSPAQSGAAKPLGP